MKVAIIGNITFPTDSSAIIHSVNDIEYDNGNDYSENGDDYIILGDYKGLIEFIDEKVRRDLISKLLTSTWLSLDEISEITQSPLSLIHELDFLFPIKVSTIKVKIK